MLQHNDIISIAHYILRLSKQTMALCTKGQENINNCHYEYLHACHSHPDILYSITVQWYLFTARNLANLFWYEFLMLKICRYCNNFLLNKARILLYIIMTHMYLLCKMSITNSQYTTSSKQLLVQDMDIHVCSYQSLAVLMI